jgi:Spx/MgsR family transcriptional regulator
MAGRIVAQTELRMRLEWQNVISGIMVAMNTPTQPLSAKTIVYGIPNCDSVKKARTWLADHAVDVTFHDFKKQGVPADLLPVWLAAVGWQTLVNRKGTTWRKLDEAARAAVVDDASATALMLEQASVIKRPVVVWGDGTISVGFDPVAFAARIQGDDKPVV